MPVFRAPHFVPTWCFSVYWADATRCPPMTYPLHIAYISAGSILIPLIIGIFSWKQQSKKTVLLFRLIIASLISDLVSFILFKFSLNSYVILNFFLLIQFLICFSLLNEKPRFSTSHRIILGCFIVFFSVDFLFIQGPLVFNSYSNSVACLILIFFTLRYFSTLLHGLPEMNVTDIPEFWIATGILSYYAGNLLLFIVSNYLVLGIGGSHAAMWILHNLLNLLKNLLFSLALWQNYRNKI